MCIVPLCAFPCAGKGGGACQYYIAPILLRTHSSATVVTVTAPLITYFVHQVHIQDAEGHVTQRIYNDKNQVVELQEPPIMTYAYKQQPDQPDLTQLVSLSPITKWSYDVTTEKVIAKQMPRFEQDFPVWEFYAHDGSGHLLQVIAGTGTLLLQNTILNGLGHPVDFLMRGECIKMNERRDSFVCNG